MNKFIRRLNILAVCIRRTATILLCIPVIMVIRAIRPLLLIRIGVLNSKRIGHFVANTELYFCERSAGINRPKQTHVDILCFIDGRVCNQQVAKMWKRVKCIWPGWLIEPLARVNEIIPGGKIHEALSRHSGRDIRNLFDRFEPYLKFTDEEEKYGQSKLLEIGIPFGNPYVCLNVRDNAYLSNHQTPDIGFYYSYRDGDIQNYLLAAEELVRRGYCVIRMGAVVNKSFISNNSKIIDYATSDLRTDFMDVYLGSKCSFCITTGSGWDGIAEVFRKPLIEVNLVPIGRARTYCNNSLFLTKRHVYQSTGIELTLNEIFSQNLAANVNAGDYVKSGVDLIELGPEEIREVVVEMVERLAGTWITTEQDEYLQRKFLEQYDSKCIDTFYGIPLHSNIRSKYGAMFLRKNSNWIM